MKAILKIFIILSCAISVVLPFLYSKAGIYALIIVDNTFYIGMVAFLAVSIYKMICLLICLCAKQVGELALRKNISLLFCLLIFLICAGQRLFLYETINGKVRLHIKAALNGIETEEAVVTLNSFAFEQKEKLIEAIKDIRKPNIKPVSKEPLQCEIISPDSSLKILIYEDPRPGPEFKNLYWVHYPEYGTSRLKNVGIFHFDKDE